VEYVSQLRGTRCRSLSSDVITRASRRKSHVKVRDDVQEFDSSSSSAAYVAGFSDCLSHVQRFLADQAAPTTDMCCQVAALSQLLVNHLNQFVADANVPRRPKDHVRSSAPSPDTTVVVVAPPSSDSTLAPLPSTSSSSSSSLRVRHSSTPQCSALTSASQTSPSVGHNALPSFLLPISTAFPPRDRLSGDVAMEQSSEYDAQHRLHGSVIAARQPVIQTPSSTSHSSPSISMSVSTGCSTCVQSTSSPGNAANDVWRPWRPETDTCLHCCDVSDASSAL